MSSKEVSSSLASKNKWQNITIQLKTKLLLSRLQEEVLTLSSITNKVTLSIQKKQINILKENYSKKKNSSIT
jgi:hypothetical protein